MKKYKYKLTLNNISCQNCVNLITKVLKKYKVKSFKIYIFENAIYLDCKQDKLELIETELASKGYHTIKMKQDCFDYVLILNILIGLLVLAVVVFGTIFAPSINLTTNISYGLIFAFGILNGLHCIAMCSPIMFLAISKEESVMKSLVKYSLGRISSYTLIGLLLGAFGSVIALSSKIQGYFTIVLAIILVVFALNVLGIIKIKFKTQNPFFKKIRNPYLIGFANILMPCGLLITMELYAMSTSNIMVAGLSMLIFAVATTIPLFITGLLSKRFLISHSLIFKIISAIIILVLAVRMFNVGLNAINTPKDTTSIELSQEEVELLPSITLEVDGGYTVKDEQYLENVEIGDYIYIKFEIINQTSCNQSFTITSPVGELYSVDLTTNSDGIVILVDEFGKYEVVCWMGMQRETFEIRENW